jgi:hypothetical protein
MNYGACGTPGLSGSVRPVGQFCRINLAFRGGGSGKSMPPLYFQAISAVLAAGRLPAALVTPFGAILALTAECALGHIRETTAR